MFTAGRLKKYNFQLLYVQPRHVFYSYGSCSTFTHYLNTLRLRQNGRCSADDIWNKFLNDLIKISLKFVSKGPIDNMPALAQIMAWRRLGNKPNWTND